MIGRRVALICSTAVLALTAACGSGQHSTPASSSPASSSPGAVPTLRVTSDVLTDGGTFAMRQVSIKCGGRNLSPDLTWTPGPAGTATYVVTMVDRDAPVAGGYWHWVAFDIPGTRSSLPVGLVPNSPDARQAVNQAGDAHYDGPCPPPGQRHHYTVTVYALSGTIDLPDGAPNDQVRSKLVGDTLASGTLTASYRR
jgi:Raf kinase inhibitor-like YbhB/YbcL family protein